MQGQFQIPTFTHDNPHLYIVFGTTSFLGGLKNLEIIKGDQYHVVWTDGNDDVTSEVVGICDVIGVVRRQDGAGGVGE